MVQGKILGREDIGDINLRATLESGQTFLWQQSEGAMYTSQDEESPWYVRVFDNDVVMIKQENNTLEWKGTTKNVTDIVTTLRLDDDLQSIYSSFPDEPVIQKARQAYPGLRVVNEPFFPTLISFICSTQMRISRIYEMQSSLRETFGSPITFDNETYYSYPNPSTLAETTEERLRDLGLGYRAPYVVETAEMVANGRLTRDDITGQPYEDARETLTQYVGVGNKVADCVLLFSLGYLQAIPLDTWIQKAVATYFPDCDKSSYSATSQALRERFGPEYAG
ncbi:MAG: DNA-3-methyladenine glycosylase, partial [Halobacteriaceae archaeon]